MGSLGRHHATYSATTSDPTLTGPNPSTAGLDIYRGSHPAEVLRMGGILVEMRGKVVILLEQWPEHPALTQVGDPNIRPGPTPTPPAD